MEYYIDGSTSFLINELWGRILEFKDTLEKKYYLEIKIISYLLAVLF